MPNNDQVNELMKELEEGVSEIFTSENYRAYLKAMSVFYDYSFRNVALIFRQCPEASHIAGFGTWSKLGRYPRKGEKAIKILAPIGPRQRDGYD